MNNRERMRTSDGYAVKWLLQNGYDEIWLKPHTRWNDTVYCQHWNYKAKDVWNLFDGACYKNGVLYFIQVQTNSWKCDKEIQEFIKTHKIKALLINVKGKTRWTVEVKSF